MICSTMRSHNNVNYSDYYMAPVSEVRCVSSPCVRQQQSAIAVSPVAFRTLIRQTVTRLAEEVVWRLIFTA